MFALDAFAGIGRSLPLVMTLVVVVIMLAIGSARIFASHNAAARCVIWQAALLASIILPVAAGFAPSLRLETTGASAPVLRAALDALAPSSHSPHRGVDPFAIVGMLWTFGCVLLAMRVARQVTAAERMRRRSVAVADNRAFTRARLDAGLASDVPVLVSMDVDVPLAVGVLRPAIIVPAACSEWSDEEWHLVLLHEHAHLVRRDLVARAIGMLAGVLHWCNPLVSWIRRRLERDAELAADGMVLSAGVLPSRYAGVLLDMAERVRWRAAPEPSLTFARAAGLELRIGELLSDVPSMAVVSRSTIVSVTTISVVVAAMLGSIQLSVRAPTIIRPSPVVAAGDWRVEARSALVALLNDPSPQVRAAAARSLEQLGTR